jgi:hypothetical protein
LNAQYTSNELFHFVGHKRPDNDEANYETLRKLLISCCVSHYPHDNSSVTVGFELTQGFQLETEELIVPTVTCYADIPFEALHIHVKKYGKFGIALPLSLLIQHGARPVIYVPMRSDDRKSIGGRTLLGDIEAVWHGFKEQAVDKYSSGENDTRSLGEKPNSTESAISAMNTIFLKDFLAYIKPYNSELPINHPNNYYMEREWRKYGNMKFETHQVSKILVAGGYADRAKEEFPTYKERIVEI